MPSLPILPKMPMGAAADEAAGVPDSINLPPLPMPPPGAAGATPPPALPPAMPPMPMTPPPMGPQSMAPASMMTPPAPVDPSQVQVRTQADGTIVGFVLAPDGTEQIVGLHPPFKIHTPKATKGDKGAPQMDFSRAAMPQMQ